MRGGLANAAGNEVNFISQLFCTNSHKKWTKKRGAAHGGTVSVLSQSFRVGKRHTGLYLRLVIDTGRGRLTAYLNGRVLKRWPYKLLND